MAFMYNSFKRVFFFFVFVFVSLVLLQGINSLRVFALGVTGLLS